MVFNEKFGWFKFQITSFPLNAFETFETFGTYIQETIFKILVCFLFRLISGTAGPILGPSLAYCEPCSTLIKKRLSLLTLIW